MGPRKSMSSPRTSSTKKHGNDQAKQQGEVSLNDVLQSNDEKHLYDDILNLAECADADLPLIFGLKCMHEFVEAINNANNQAVGEGVAVPPCPFPLPDPLTRESFKEALLEYARAGTAGPFGSTCLPCTPSELTRAISRLNIHPWTQYIIAVGGADNVLPIAELCVPRPRTNMLEYALDQHQKSLWTS